MVAAGAGALPRGSDGGGLASGAPTPSRGTALALARLLVLRADGDLVAQTSEQDEPLSEEPLREEPFREEPLREEPLREELMRNADRSGERDNHEERDDEVGEERAGELARLALLQLEEYPTERDPSSSESETSRSARRDGCDAAPVGLPLSANAEDSIDRRRRPFAMHDTWSAPRVLALGASCGDGGEVALERRLAGIKASRP
jgi:hypothetical protein